MIEQTDRRVITRVESGRISECEDVLVQQMTYSLELNGEHSITSVCCPGELQTLAYGYLVTMGYLKPGEKPVSIHRSGSVVKISLEKRKAMEVLPVVSDYVLTPEIIIQQVKEFVRAGVLFKKTGATHSASISRENLLECYVEDISRSAVLEKVIGSAFLKNIEMNNSFIILSSRVPEAFVRKIALAGIPIIAAISAPTTQAVHEAGKLGVCLCGFVRGERMNVYANKWRLGI